jgi:ubiquitin C-terminal hydrolase
MKIYTKLKNSCFLDSSLNCFLSLNDFCWDILSIKIKKENKEMELVSELKDLIKKKNNNEILDFKKIKEILGKVNEEYNKNNQEDVNEFISIFLEQLVKELIGKGDKSKKEFRINKEDKESFNKLQTNFLKKMILFCLIYFMEDTN